jgi:hypothetical protein
MRYPESVGQRVDKRLVGHWFVIDHGDGAADRRSKRSTSTVVAP